MGKLIIPQNHISLICEQDVQEICSDLFQRYHLNHFQYGRIYVSGEMICLINNKAFVEYWIKNELRPISSIKPDQIDKQRYFVVWENCIPESYLKFARELFNITQGVSVINRHENYYEIFGFGAPAESQGALDFYINNTELLLQFTAYFKDKAELLIKKAENDKLILPAHMQDENRFKMMWRQPQANFASDIPKRHYLGYKSKDNYLTQSELDCFQLLCQGKTIKQTALKLEISNRTVESYINRVKRRLNCYSTSQILELVLKNF